jgi:hypothetical protein
LGQGASDDATWEKGMKRGNGENLKEKLRKKTAICQRKNEGK